MFLSGLWVRLGACPYFPVTIDPDSQKFIWEIVKRLEDVDIFELPTERAPLVLFNRFELVDHELGHCVEPVSQCLYKMSALSQVKLFP